MIFDIKIDQIEDIRAIRDAIIKNQFTVNGGLTVVQWMSEGTSTTKAWAISPVRLLEETKAFLKLADPDMYGSIVKRIKPQYTAT